MQNIMMLETKLTLQCRILWRRKQSTHCNAEYYDVGNKTHIAMQNNDVGNKTHIAMQNIMMLETKLTLQCRILWCWKQSSHCNAEYYDVGNKAHIAMQNNDVGNKTHIAMQNSMMLETKLTLQCRILWCWKQNSHCNAEYYDVGNKTHIAMQNNDVGNKTHIAMQNVMVLETKLTLQCRILWCWKQKLTSDNTVFKRALKLMSA